MLSHNLLYIAEKKRRAAAVKSTEALTKESQKKAAMSNRKPIGDAGDRRNKGE